MANRIHRKGDFRYDEALAGEAGIYPGMLLELNSDAEVIKHDDEGGRAERMFAQEDALQGKTVATVYTSGAIVGYILPVPGAEVNALIQGGQNISIGDELISAGDGTLKAASDVSSSVDEVIAVAMEAFDDSDDTLVAVRIK
jgi:hypothetical protein